MVSLKPRHRRVKPLTSRSRYAEEWKRILDGEFLDFRISVVGSKRIGERGLLE
jgi:hypothetical protein